MKEIIKAFLEVKGDMLRDTGYFINRNDGSLYGTDGTLYIKSMSVSADLEELNKAAKDENSTVFSEGDISEKDLSSFGSYVVTDDFYRFLSELDSWGFAKGKFEQEMSKLMSN